MKTIKRNKFEEQRIQTLIKDDKSFDTWAEYRENHFENYRNEFGDIQSYLNQRRPKFEDNPNPVMKEFLDSQNADLESIRKSTIGNDLSSHVSAKKVMGAYENVLKRLQTKAKKNDENFESKPMEEQNKSLEKLLGNKKVMKYLMYEEMKQTSEEVKEEQETLRSFGFNGDGISQNEDVNQEDLLTLMELMKSNDMIKKIMAMVGKMINTTKHNISNRVEGFDNILGVELGDNLNQLIPSEIAKLVIPEFEDLQLLKLVNKECIQYEKDAEDTMADGDIIVCIDESASMHYDDNIVKAKAILFGIVEKARHDKRDVDIVLFGGYSEQEIFRNATKGDLIDIISTFRRYGSTNFEKPLSIALDIAGKKSDIIFITDGLAPISNGLENELQSAKEKNGVKLITMQFGSTCNSKLEEISSSFNTSWSLFESEALS